jgi:hypothetical protein
MGLSQLSPVKSSQVKSCLLSQCPSARLEILQRSMRLCGHRDDTSDDYLAFGRVNSPFHHRAVPARRRAFRNSITRYFKTRPLSRNHQCDWPRLPAGDGFPTRAGVGATYLPALWTAWNPSLRTRRPLLCDGMPQREYGKLSQSVGVRVGLNRIVVVCRASVQRATAIGSRIVHRHWIALQSRPPVPWPVSGKGADR